MYSFTGNRILIAGGSSGIGLSTAKLLAASGANIIISGRNPEKLKKAAESIEGDVTVYQFDASNASERQFALQQIGNIDHLVITLSGGSGGGPFASLLCDDLRGAFEAKFFTHFSLAQEALPFLRSDGSITFVSAISARAANPGTSGLAAVNAAIEGMIPPLAVELKPLRVNAVSPGVIDTPWWNMFNDTDREKLFTAFSKQTPAGRVGTPDDIAQAIMFLIGSTFTTGTVIECDGGLRLTGHAL